MPNKGAIYQARNSNSNYFREIPRGIEKDFDEAYRKFFAKRGVDVTKENTMILDKNWRLSDPIFVDTHSLNKAIEYGRSYRKNAPET